MTAWHIATDRCGAQRLEFASGFGVLRKHPNRWPRLAATRMTPCGPRPRGAPRFRTIQVCPKDFLAMPRQSEGAAPATFMGGLTMSERFVDEGQSWASDIIGVVSGVGLYSALFFLVTFLCLYFPA
jgi:hypothetical protein